MTGYDLAESYSTKYHRAEAARLAALHRAQVAEATLDRVRALANYFGAERDHYAYLVSEYGAPEYTARWAAYGDAVKRLDHILAGADR